MESEPDRLPMNHSSRQLCCFPFIVTGPVIVIKVLKKQLKNLWLQLNVLYEETICYTDVHNSGLRNSHLRWKPHLCQEFILYVWGTPSHTLSYLDLTATLRLTS